MKRHSYYQCKFVTIAYNEKCPEIFKLYYLHSRESLEVCKHGHKVTSVLLQEYHSGISVEAGLEEASLEAEREHEHDTSFIRWEIVNPNIRNGNVDTETQRNGGTL